jgi:hypothetical protein
LRVRDRAVKDRSATLFAVKLRAGDQGKAGVDREAVRGRQPRRVVFWTRPGASTPGGRSSA